MTAHLASIPAYRLSGVDYGIGLAVVARLGSSQVIFDSDEGELQFASNRLHDVPWDTYELLIGAARHGRFRHSYDAGVLEMMSPSLNHEATHRFIARLLEAWCNAAEIPIFAAGSTTQRRQPQLQGVEPDSSFYIQHEPLVRARWLEGRDDIPPPDLAVEVDATNSSAPRLSIYARIGVPEVWRYDGKRLEFLKRSPDGRYEAIKGSAAFPRLEPDDILQMLARRGTCSDTALVNEFVRLRKKKLVSRKTALKSPRKPKD
jgi:Uma2 family endonuclease